MDAEAFLHKHYLLYDEYKKQDASCDRCNEQINGWAFTCQSCKFWRHKSCALLPLRISHPIHQHLFLKISNRDFICSSCFTLSRGYVFKNEDGFYKLDVVCALSINDRTSNEESKISKDIGKKIQHSSHNHSLTLFNYRKVRKYEYYCNWCEKPLSGLSYGCFRCRFEKFFFHQSCLYTMPIRILEHPFHPLHPLYINSNISNSFCNACKDRIIENGYSCNICNFHLHVLCAKLKPTLRHECHPEHNLTYIVNNQKASFQCNKCDSSYEAKQWEKRAFYCCVQCTFNIHFECLIPSNIRHKYHRHSLTATTSFIEDDSGEYYCDICEEQRNPKHHVYCCEKCTYITHIECALDKFVDAKSQQGDATSSLEQEESQQSDANFPTRRLIEHLNHQHPLRFKEVIRIQEYGNEQLFCQACELEVCDQAYFCQKKGCNYYVHKACAELSFQLIHPFHSQHPLVLQTRCNPWTKIFICDKCRSLSDGFVYCCFICNLKLDIKCAVAAASKIVNQELNKIESQPTATATATATNLFHFIHSHELLLVNCVPTQTKQFRCQACFSNILGPAYCCLHCYFYIHETCLGKLPQVIQIPFHPQHALLPFVVEVVEKRTCLACKSETYGIYYSCCQCDIYFHFSCAGSLNRPLSSKSHPHDLYFFQRDKLKYFNKVSKCAKCNNFCARHQSICHCIECDINFHFQCAGIPYKVKSKCHIHPLTLKKSFKEDDSGEYYCDTCEEERDPQDDVYYCEECNGQFVAHIECVISEVEEVLQQ